MRQVKNSIRYQTINATSEIARTTKSVNAGVNVNVTVTVLRQSADSKKKNHTIKKNAEDSY